jgi:hypothetical protein
MFSIRIHIGCAFTTRHDVSPYDLVYLQSPPDFVHLMFLVSKQDPAYTYCVTVK